MADHKQEVIEELEAIREAAGGVLKPEDVVECARDEENVLHSQFTWDDGAAAEQYRLWEARQLIRVCVTVLPQTEMESRVYVSLSGDRKREGGGYRALCEVLSDTQLRDELLAAAERELNEFTAKYRQLAELGEVFAAAERLRKRRQKAQAKRQNDRAPRVAIAAAV